MYLKQPLGSVLVFGLEAPEHEIIKFETLCHNYSICDKPVRWHSQFSFVKTTLPRLFNGLTNFYKNTLFIEKMKTEECNSKQIFDLARQIASDTIEEATNSSFYTIYLEEINKNKRYIENLLGIFDNNQNSIKI